MTFEIAGCEKALLQYVANATRREKGAVREIFVTELVKEVLGPRNGLREVIDSSPLNEYITGVLAPVVEQAVRDVDNEAEIPLGESQIYEEETGSVDVQTPPLLSPVLDPKSRPPSMGLSFVVEAEGSPEIDVCLTWARYEPVEGKNVWERRPKYFTATVSVNSSQVIWIDSYGRKTNPDDAEISFHIMSTPRTGRLYYVTLYVVNRIRFSPLNPEDLPRAEHHIFQPEIRVTCKPGVRMVPEVERARGGDEEKELSFIYRKRPVLARGHLCSAVWKDIDPQASFECNLDFPSSLTEPPFCWVDGALLPEQERRRFYPPDVRTEFVPIYSITSPDLNWPAGYGDPPELSAGKLAESWSTDELHKCLQPMVSGYKKWIDDLEESARSFPQDELQIALQLVERCRQVLERIRKGIDLLIANEDARLAFCFANKAIDLQSQWTQRQNLTWRPFQLAFVVMTLESIVNSSSSDRDICDLLLVPTGAGKTEAYLAIAAFTMAYRRRRALRKSHGDRTGAGVSIITRYTLRLLTIQQFRRALATVTACEYLRVHGLGTGNPVGWRPKNCAVKENFLWGSTPFSIGLWVGGGVTPNKLFDSGGGNNNVLGALSILKGRRGEGEPAQVLNCPACNAILAVPEMGLGPRPHTLHLVIHSDGYDQLSSFVSRMPQTYDSIKVFNAKITPHQAQGYWTLTLQFSSNGNITAVDIDNFWMQLQSSLQGVRLVPMRASRPGYFVRWYLGLRGGKREYNFEIFCPNPECPLHTRWCAGLPSGSVHGRMPTVSRAQPFLDGNLPLDVQEAFQLGSVWLSDRIPIPALTVDDQIYHYVPTMVVVTVDKFARLPFEPRSAALFGNVEYHHCIQGYYRKHLCSLRQDARGHPMPFGTLQVQVPGLDPPDLFLQDELHLIEGPLGSLVGTYETSVDYLCQEASKIQAKYIASTATVRRAREQVQSVFARRLQIFPPPGLSADRRFFINDYEVHPLDDERPGRLYLGVCAPGKGPLTPIVRIWARLLQTAWNNRNHSKVDTFWTLTGYFNAVRELAGARALYREDIQERLADISAGDPRPIPDDRCQELSSRTNSTDLPVILDLLNRTYPEAIDALFTTSMFGTGVDVPRIGLMVVDGQPKTTSAYIQSTGRVGRRRGALVVIFFRAARPRDLNHYEFFCGYHRQLHRFVEPITVYPFAPGVIERAGGPLAVSILRNMRSASVPWHKDDAAAMMASQRLSAPEVATVVDVIEKRVRKQPSPKDTAAGSVRLRLASMLDRWQNIARLNTRSLRYVEYAIVQPRYPVVLGDPQHQHSRLGVVYENAPQSLRDIEETTGFET